MNQDLLNTLSIKSGKDIATVTLLLSQAEHEAELMGMTGNYAYITSTLETLLDLKENEIVELVTEKYLLDENSDFNSYLEGMMVSGNFTVTPEFINRKVTDNRKKKKAY